MSDKNPDKSKQEIIDYFFEKKDDESFKWLQIQAWPWTWKTYLLSHIISKYIEEWHDDNFYILSHSNSSIDSISNKIWNKNNVEIKTVASFFIENFIIPFSYTILENEKLDDLQIYHYGTLLKKEDIKKFLRSITNNFSENNIPPRTNLWNILDWINEKYLWQEKYFNLFHTILIQKWVKYIFIDEYQDTKKCYLNIFNKIIEKWEIKFICVWDKNQQINFDDFQDNYFIWLENDKVLETTYRFWNTILEKVNNIIPSWILKPSDSVIIDWCIDDNLPYTPKQWTEKERLENLLNFIIEYINSNKNIFNWKKNVILFQSSTDYWLWDKVNKTLKQLLDGNSEIFFPYTEKPIYNIQLKLFFQKLISFVNWNITYSDVEKELKFFYEKWDNNYQEIFWRIIKLKNTDNISSIWDILQEDWFKKWWNYKEYFKIIIDCFLNNEIKFNEADWKTLIDILNLDQDDKIYISTSTITSSKWKEYDNVFILNTYNDRWKIESFSQKLKDDHKEAKRHYYVAVSRAKENVITFVDY